MGKTISFVKGRGHISHNNRDFISNNVVPERTEWNRTYVKESIESAYDTCFGQALKDYNARQKRKDRQKHDYITEIRNSKNKEKVFYENVVQIGSKNDTAVADENGCMTDEAAKAAKVLEKYAQTFQERNPNLYLFNCVLHMDEATLHLHMDYIPVAHGYKSGMETRNSLTKALQQMGFDKAKSRNENETVAWQKREREYLTELCQEQGIEIDVLGISRDNLTLPEYKAAMREVESLEEQADRIKVNNQEQWHENIQLKVEAQRLTTDVEQLEEKAVELAGRIDQLETKEREQCDKIDKYGIRADGIAKISKEVAAEVKIVKAAATPVKSIFGGEAYVKVKKSEWSRIEATFEKALTRNKLLDRYEAKIAELEKTVDYLKTRVEKYINRIKEMKKFLTEKNLLHEFLNLTRKQEQETMQERIDRKNAEAREKNEQTDRSERRNRGVYGHNI